MKLVVKGEKYLVTTDFGKWLIPQIKSHIVSNVNKGILKSWDKELIQLIRKEASEQPKEEVALAALCTCAEKLICTENIDGISILVSPEEKLHDLKLSVLAKTLNFGTLTHVGCHIFTDTYKYFADNIDTFFDMYQELRGVYVY